MQNKGFLPTIRSASTKVVSLVKQHALRAYITVLTALTVLFLGLAPSTVSHAQTFSFDVSPMLTEASQIFNGLFPVFALVIGIGLGIGLLVLVANKIENIVSRRG